MFLVLGTAMAVVLSFFNPATENSSIFYLFLCGIVAVCSMILPGLSGSFVLILMGNYQLVAIDAIGLIGGDEAISLLQTLWKEARSDQVQVEAKAALLRISSEYADLFLEELLQEETKRQEYALQKLIDLFGEDFGFIPGTPLLHRKEAIKRIMTSISTL